MKRTLAFLIITLFISSGADVLHASVTLPFSTTFNCSEWIEDGSPCTNYPTCDGIEPLVWTWTDDLLTSIITGANNPAGGGGRGLRMQIGPGQNYQSDIYGYSFSSQTEIWIRLYIRYQSGITWDGGVPAYHKIIYLCSGGSTIGGFEFQQGKACIWSNAESFYHLSSSVLWNSSWSNGSWHCVEAHAKFGSSASADLWFDGSKVVTASSINWGFSSCSNFEVHCNQMSPSGYYYVDYDDIAISATGYIGPLAGGESGTAPTAAFSGTPTSGNNSVTVQFTDESTDSPTSWAWDFENDGVIDSFAQNPSHTFTVGTYTVKLTATNAYGNDSETKAGYITVSAVAPPPATPAFSHTRGGTRSRRGWFR